MSLTYGPVKITKGTHKGKVGLYDDDKEGDFVRSAIIYLGNLRDRYWKNPVVFVNPKYLKNVKNGQKN